MIGLSLSFCIRDIVSGKVHEEDVQRIESSTAYRTEEDWERGLENYCEQYWQTDPDQALRIVQILRDEGRITQPRLVDPDGYEAPNLQDGWWLDGLGDKFGVRKPK